jgi:hypothetical protein
MPVTLEFRENGHVLHYIFSDPWEVGDLTALYPQSTAYLQNAPGKVHTLADVRDAHRLPSGLLTVRHGPDWSHENGGWIAVVGAMSLLKIFANIVFQLSQFDRVVFFDSEGEAWAYLRNAITAEVQTAALTGSF